MEHTTTLEPMNILLAEDNDDHAELVMRSMEDNKVVNKIFRVPNGKEAINYLLREGEFADVEKSPRPNLILLDLRMPKMDGLEVLKTIRNTENIKNIPVVILSTSKAEQDVAKAYEYHANSYLVKPLDFFKFDELMTALGFYWLTLNQQPVE